MVELFGRERPTYEGGVIHGEVDDEERNYGAALDA